jgi:hypothetical protein
VTIRRLRGLLQLVVGLVEQGLGLRGVALHIPLIGLLRGNYFLPGLLAQPLCGCEVGMTRRIDILLGVLRNRYTDNEKKYATTTAVILVMFMSSPWRRNRQFRHTRREFATVSDVLQPISHDLNGN